ncbi:MAG: ammonium transporter [Senegalimassilia anaerobia]|uniref:ammonium transporter n=1 Tax=Senegalimassilia anaerobia TaxID=1473216 RepID=UPI002E76429B|nr:ammonium transporter [Senegalimassilia anaerobia]MEE0304215.1 ammonium transporter [Senegalimassilia anaerobia]
MYDTGSTAFMLVCAMLVLLMTPGLAFFYGGLSRRKNVVNTMIMVFSAIGIVAITWTICGWSLAYGGDGSSPFFGGFDQLGFLGGVTDMLAEAEAVPEDAAYPTIINFIFQMAFCMITTAIITGSLAGRMKFGAVCAFVAVWTIVVYPPLAHLVWGGDGSLIGDTIGALDFAGGDVVHISSGLTGLILCLMLGKRKGFGMMSYRPHNVPFVALGAALLWFGWFGFNAGSEFVADGVAGLALINTVVASGAALVSWMIVERVKVGKPTLVGAATGLVAGLVVITPAAGFVEPWAAIIMGLIVSPICYFAISFCKAKIGYDDALDAFGCHAVGGIVGGICTGIFCVPELSWTDFGGLLYTGDVSLLCSQIAGIAITIVFVGILDVVLAFIVKACFKGSLRVSEEKEAQGLDIAAHGESAYPAYIGLD